MSTLQQFIRAFAGFLNKALVVVAAVALLVFFWGILKYVLAAGNELDKVKARNIMLWGLIALFVMVSVWGIVFFLQREFSLNLTEPPLRGGTPVL